MLICLTHKHFKFQSEPFSNFYFLFGIFYQPTSPWYCWISNFVSSIRWACLSSVKLQILLSLFTITSGICRKKKGRSIRNRGISGYELLPILEGNWRVFSLSLSVSSSIHFSSIVFIFIYSHSVGLWTNSKSTSNFIVSILTIHFSEEHSPDVDTFFSLFQCNNLSFCDKKCVVTMAKSMK